VSGHPPTLCARGHRVVFTTGDCYTLAELEPGLFEYVIGPCEKCGKEERALLMFEDYGMGYECLSCGHSERVDRVEWIEGDKLPPDWGLA